MNRSHLISIPMLIIITTVLVIFVHTSNQFAMSEKEISAVDNSMQNLTVLQMKYLDHLKKKRDIGNYSIATDLFDVNNNE